MKVLIFGEAMLEYHSHGGSGLRFGGDTLNTAIHMARKGCDVAYVTALGTDPISDALIAAWEAEGIDTRHVLRHPDRSPGIYAIHLDDNGERSFLYWRERSAAREMFAQPGMKEALDQAQKCDLLYFSLISLAIVDEAGRRELIDLAAARKQAGLAVAYDSNYRPSLWGNPRFTRGLSMAAAASATIGLPTNVDECQLFERTETEEAIARRWLSAGCSEVVVKAGEKGCLFAGNQSEPEFFDAKKVDVVDSSGAGDAFNAGFLQARLSGADLPAAIESAQDLAAATLAHLGAIQL